MDGRMMSVTGIQALAACGYLSWLRLRNADASRRGQRRGASLQTTPRMKSTRNKEPIRWLPMMTGYIGVWYIMFQSF